MNTHFVEIRKATLADLENIQSCAYLAYSKYVDRMKKEPAPMNADYAAQIENGAVDVAVVEHKFAGYVVFYPDGDHFHLESVAVVPEQSRRGIGRALIDYVERTARSAGVNAVELYTNEVMIENIAMYQKMGYKEIARKRQAEFNRVFFRKTW